MIKVSSCFILISAVLCPDEEEFSPSERLHQPRHQPRHQDHHRAQPEERRAPPRAYAPAVGPAPLIFLAPLAGIAALYAMAFVQQNPALLTLVTVSGRRKRCEEKYLMLHQKIFNT